MGSVANAALARAAELKKNPKAKTTTKAKTAPKPRLVKSDVPWKRIAALYEQGKSTAEISDALELTRPKTKEGKENPYPYYLTVGYLTRLSHGVKVGDDTIKIKRGTGSRKKK